MTVRLSVLYILLGFAVAISSPAGGVEARGSGAKGVCWSLHFSGVVLGITTDDEVKRLLGNGAYRAVQGGGRGRYFLNLDRTATLHVVSFTDGIVGEVSVAHGVDLTLKTEETGSGLSFQHAAA